MAYTISALDTALKQYTDGQSAALVANTILGVDSLQRMTLQTGVKAITPIVKFTTPANFQDGSSCGFSASGNTAFTNRMLNPAAIKVQTEWCPETLLGTWAAHEVRVAAGSETMPFEEKILDEISRNIKVELEKLIWQGDKTNGSGNMAFLDGITTLIKQDVANSVITNVLTAGASDTIYDRVKAVFRAMPENTINRATLCMSVANYKDLVVALMEANLYHYNEGENAELNLTFPGTTMKVQAIRGLAGDDNLYCVPMDELVYGVDLENDAEQFDFWFERSSQTFRLNCKFMASVNYAFPENICVSVPNASITLNKTSTTIANGSTEQLTATVVPAGSTVTWSSSDETKATVATDGTVTGVAAGSATITAAITPASGVTYTATCAVTIS